jgi:hypothetical protein
METKEISIKKLALKGGLLTSLGLIAFFLLMYSLNLLHILELRGLNFFILLGGIYFTYHHYRSITHPHIDYFTGMLLGCLTAVVSIIPFALFVFFFFWLIDPQFIMLLNGHALFMGIRATPELAAETILIEGIISGVIISFALMQFYKSEYSSSSEEKGVQ